MVRLFVSGPADVRTVKCLVGCGNVRPVLLGFLFEIRLNFPESRPTLTDIPATIELDK